MAYDQQICARLEPLTFYLPQKTLKEVSGYMLENTADLRRGLHL